VTAPEQYDELSRPERFIKLHSPFFAWFDSVKI
jgi:hypothetical protein